MKKIEFSQSKPGFNIENCYSKARYSAYTSMAMYYYDIELSEAFYPALRTLEIVLRNSLWNAITNTIDCRNWLTDGSILREQEQKIVLETQDKINSGHPNRAHEIDHLISELNFGFWNNLLNVRYEQIFWPRCLKSFVPYVPRRYRYRKFIHKRLQKIRNLRNRIFHHQRISHMHGIDQQHQEILEVIGWIEPKILEHLKRIDRFQSVYQKELTNLDME
jgi:hypothetical protein